MNKIYFSICAMMLCCFTMANAQTKTSLTYSMGFPMGDLGDFIQKTSFRGVTFDYRKMTNISMGVGVSFGWNVFYEERPYDTYTSGTASLSGKQYRYSNHFPMLASFDYFLKPGKHIDPYVGLGTGVIYTRRNTDMNLYTIEQEAWNFALQPQIGIEIDNSYSSSFTIVLKYYNGFKAGDFDKPQSYLALNVGWIFKT